MSNDVRRRGLAAAALGLFFLFIRAVLRPGAAT
jgi:hypothetical protein